VKEPQRNIPRGLIAGMLIVTAIYMLMNIAYAYVLPIDVMAKSKLVAADVAEKCFAGGGRWIALGVMISTFGTANATILASARVYFRWPAGMCSPGSSAGLIRAFIRQALRSWCRASGASSSCSAALSIR